MKRVYTEISRPKVAASRTAVAETSTLLAPLSTAVTTNTQENVFDHQRRQLNTIHIAMCTYNLQYIPRVARVVIIIIIIIIRRRRRRRRRRRKTYLWHPIS